MSRLKFKKNDFLKRMKRVINESLDKVISKSDKLEDITVGEGLKIVHIPTGYVYTIKSVSIDEDTKSPMIIAHRYEDSSAREGIKTIQKKIKSHSFKDYDRL